MTTAWPWQTPSLTDQSKLRKPGSYPQRDVDASFGNEFSLDSSSVDFHLARALYRNTDPRYKLGAGFARPAIDVPVGFMGVPILGIEDRGGEAQATLDRHIKYWRGQILKAHQMAARDGRVLIKIQDAFRSPAYSKLFSKEERLMGLTLFPTESYEILSTDEDMGAVEAVKITHIFLDENDQERKLYETITAGTITLVYENNYRPPREYRNPLGFVPALELTNDQEMFELHARSDLEPLEPYLKFYNDVMLHAGSASALHSTAKLKIRVRDLERFLNNNFTTTEITEGRLKFKGKDVLFFESGDPDQLSGSGGTAYAEDAEIIQAEAPLGGTTTLLEYIFLNIVDVSEVPEWAFGGSIQSSKASVSEQSGPLVHKVNRRRDAVSPVWGLAGRMVVQILHKKSSAVEVTWSDLDMRDLKTEAEAFRNFTESLIALNDSQTVSKETVNEVLRSLIPQILPYEITQDDTEKARLSSEVEEMIEKSRELMQQTEKEDDEDDRQNGLRAVGSEG